jgi:hypothetical protein
MKIYKVSPILKYSPFFALTYVSKEEFGIGEKLKELKGKSSKLG